MSIPYRFLPWVRRGLARSHQNPDDGQNNLATRPKVSVGLTLLAKQDDQKAADVSGKIDLTLYGPGDVIGIDPRLIVRTDPKPNITNFEPNYLAVIDFDPPDFPWLLTPARANNHHNLRPWLVLVVVDRNVVEAKPHVKPGQPLPTIFLKAGQVASELPDLAESWLWAHGQTVLLSTDPVKLARVLVEEPAINVSRLICPRRLSPDRDYIACVVPAFEVGRLRGLGKPIPPDMNTLTPAWIPGQDLELPLYYHWEFSTGPVGDIETLARRLQTPKQYQSKTEILQQLRHIGEQPVGVDADHLLFAGTTPDKTVFEGAMVSLDFIPEPASQHPLFAKNLADMLNSGQELISNATEKANSVPTLSPPIYGEHPAKRHSVDQNLLNSHWLDQLNLQPRYRLAAGWGAEIVRLHQDEFMQAAWTQVGEVLAAERALSLSRLAHDVLRCIEKRHLQKLPEHRLLAVLGAARGRIKIAPNQSLFGRIQAATLPDELFDGAMRRLTSPQRATFKMAQFRERELGAARVSTVKQMAGLVKTFASATQNLTSIDPNRFVPDGIMGSRSFDTIPLPADPKTMVDLQPYTGLPGSMSAEDIRQIVSANKTTLAQAATTKATLPKMGDIWNKGLLTDTHQLRIQELQMASSSILGGDLQRLIQQASPQGAHGVLLSVQENGQISAQPLKIDGRNGHLNALDSPTAVAGQGAINKLGDVPVSELRLFGKRAVIKTLPSNTLGGNEPVAINLDQPGRFRPVQEAVTARPSITLPPAIKERAILERYAEAFKDYQQLWVAPQDEAKVAIRPLDFAISPATLQVRSRIDPGQTIPARLASMLSLADHPAVWSRDKGLSHDFISSRHGLALSERLRYVIPKTFDRVMAYPHLVFPLSRKLERVAPEVFLPGVGALPDDFIMAVQTNPRFVEALMLGANHEMGRELLWQGFPTDQRGTPFQHFWQRLDPKTDIPEIHDWGAKPLGGQPGNAEMLVLLIRGQLLERFPTLSVYAYPKELSDERPGQSEPPPASAPGESPKRSEMAAGKTVLPVFKGRLGKDISYVGFDIAPQKMEGFFFILEEQMTEPRFGFDEPDNDGQNGPSWLDVDWSEVNVDAGKYFRAANLKLAPPATLDKWQNPHAATVADALLQRPFRGYYAGAALKMPK